MRRLTKLSRQVSDDLDNGAMIFHGSIAILVIGVGCGLYKITKKTLSALLRRGLLLNDGKVGDTTMYKGVPF